jgi:nucleoside-diphosphate-sugar epimerase
VSTLIVGCGYLGRRVGARLREHGEQVWGTVRSLDKAAELHAIGIEPVLIDVLEVGSLRSLPIVDRVFYCVGFDRASGATLRTVYVDGLQNVLDNLPGLVMRLVYASSTGVYGQTGGEWVDESSAVAPRHESGKACLEAELRLAEWAEPRAFQLSTIVLRFAGLYGPGRVVRRSVLERGEPIASDPDKLLNLIHIDDAAGAVLAALDASHPERVYLISDDRPVTRREYYCTAAALLGGPEPRFSPPRGASLEAARDATSKRVANHRMKRGLGVVLAFPDIRTGLPAALGLGAGPF